MATKRDLVEAYSFSRRRLVTAFVSGAPGGREVEPARPGRTIVGGLALAVLLMAGAAIAGVFAPKDPEDWTQPGLIVSKETGAAYVIVEESEHPVLRPVINITSARLILDTGGDVEPRIVSQKTIESQTIGDDIGILGAPASVPDDSLLIPDGWTACTRAGSGLRVDVSATSQARAALDNGFVVTSQKTTYVIAEASDGTGAHRYQLPAGGKLGEGQDNLLADLQLPNRAGGTEVPEEWLALFPEGGDLSWDTFGLTGFGDPAPDRGEFGIPGDARIGDVLTTGDESLLLTQDGPEPLDDFALAVYRNSPTPTGRIAEGSRSGRAPVEWTLDSPPNVGQVKGPYESEHWPSGTLRATEGDHCALLAAEKGEAPVAHVATDATGDASPADVREGERSVRVQPGRGAYVLSGDWGQSAGGAPFLIDAKGQSYPLEGPDVATRLGYGDYPVAEVPDSWVGLFDEGVYLSVDAALCPPRSEGSRGCA
ncbi:type VII secretion protein EccB [Nocardioides sp. MAHUQ-72]|uniref:type VII secretion protein EccB n=1 Tax=unclassified Nocardioides TaxID=2615069 RepID=UPI0036186448